MKTLILTLILMSIVGCTTKKPSPIIYTDSWAEDWKRGVINKCRNESVFITLQMYEANRHWTEQEVIYAEKLIVESCFNHFKITI